MASRASGDEGTSCRFFALLRFPISTLYSLLVNAMSSLWALTSVAIDRLSAIERSSAVGVGSSIDCSPRILQMTQTVSPRA